MDGPTASLSAAGLAPAEGLTVVVGLPTGVVPTPQPILEERWSLERAFTVTAVTVGLSGGLALVLFLLGWPLRSSEGAFGRAVRDSYLIPHSGRSSRAEPPPVELTPPADLPPALMGVLMHGNVRPAAVTATIIDLAARGHLRIEEVADHRDPDRSDWRFVSLKDPDRNLLGYELLLLLGLFPSARDRKSGVALSSLDKHFSDRYERVRAALGEEAVRRGWYASRPDKLRTTLIPGAVVFALGVVLTFAAVVTSGFGLVPVPIILAGCALLGTNWRANRTLAGRELLRRVVGFRNHLKGAATPAGQVLGQYPSYAMLFGLTKQWAATARSERRPTGTGAAPRMGSSTPWSTCPSPRRARSRRYRPPRAPAGSVGPAPRVAAAEGVAVAAVEARGLACTGAQPDRAQRSTAGIPPRALVVPAAASRRRVGAA